MGTTYSATNVPIRHFRGGRNLATKAGDGPELSEILRDIYSYSSQSDVLRAGVGYIYQSGVTLDAETISIGTGATQEVYEFDTTAPPGAITAGRIRVGVSGGEGGTGAANSCTQLAAAINTNSSLVYARVVAGANIVALTPASVDITSVGNYALATTGVNTTVSAAAMVGGSTNPLRLALPLEYTVTAVDVARWLAGQYTPIATFPFTTQPDLYSITWDRAGSIGNAAAVQYRFAQVNSNYWVLEVLDGAAIFLAADLIRFVIAV